MRCIRSRCGVIRFGRFRPGGEWHRENPPVRRIRLGLGLKRDARMGPVEATVETGRRHVCPVIELQSRLGSADRHAQTARRAFQSRVVGHGAATRCEAEIVVEAALPDLGAVAEIEAGVLQGATFTGRDQVVIFRQPDVGGDIQFALKAHVAIGQDQREPGVVRPCIFDPSVFLAVSAGAAMKRMLLFPVARQVMGLAFQRESPADDPVGEAPDQRAEIGHWSEIGLKTGGAQNERCGMPIQTQVLNRRAIG